MEHLKTEQEFNNNKLEKYFDNIKLACKGIHACADAKKKAEKAQEVLKSENKEELWNVFQEYLREYAGFINKTTCLTGVTVYAVDENFFDIITIDELKVQIKGVIAFVYLREALIIGVETAFKQALKGLLKATKIFSDKELSFL